MTYSEDKHQFDTSKKIKFAPDQEAIIREAIGLLEATLQNTEVFSNPTAVKDFCKLKIGHLRDEYFCCLFLNNQHHLIAFERLFRGTIDGAAVHPRIVVRRALELNAAAVILVHNHPSGISEPSGADKRMTERLVSALGTVDIRILDHIIVTAGGSQSMAEAGLI